MDEMKAREILQDCIEPDNSLYSSGRYLFWNTDIEEEATLDGRFLTEELEAIIWWMKNMRKI